MLIFEEGTVATISPENGESKELQAVESVKPIESPTVVPSSSPSIYGVEEVKENGTPIVIDTSVQDEQLKAINQNLIDLKDYAAFFIGLVGVLIGVTLWKGTISKL